MEHCIENRCAMTEQALTEMARATQKWGVHIVCAVMGALCIGLTVAGRGDSTTLGIGVAGLFVAAYGAFFAPLLAGKQQAKRHLELYQTAPVALVSLTEREVVLKNEMTEGESRFEYAQFRQVIETKNLFVMVTRRRLAVMLDKNGFTEGSAEAFRALVREKMPGAKLKLK